MDQQKTQWFSLYHSLQHYKYHTYLMCKDEVRGSRTLLSTLLSHGLDVSIVDLYRWRSDVRSVLLIRLVYPLCFWRR